MSDSGGWSEALGAVGMPVLVTLLCVVRAGMQSVLLFLWHVAAPQQAQCSLLLLLQLLMLATATPRLPADSKRDTESTNQQQLIQGANGATGATTGSTGAAANPATAAAPSTAPSSVTWPLHAVKLLLLSGAVVLAAMLMANASLREALLQDTKALLLLLPPVILHLISLWHSKQHLQKLWLQAGPPHYKPSAMRDVLFERIYFAAFTGLEQTYACAFVLPLLLPSDHFVVHRGQALLLLGCTVVEVWCLVWLESFRPYWKDFYLQARYLGKWQKCNATGGRTWEPQLVFNQGDLVRHRKQMYRAVDRHNMADPSDRVSEIIWHLFRYPARHVEIVIKVLLVVLVAETFMLMWARHHLLIIVWGVAAATTLTATTTAVIMRRRIHVYCTAQDEQPLSGHMLTERS